MIKGSILKTIIFLSLLMPFGLTACDDISNSINDTSPPAIPEIASAQPDLGYFSNESGVNSKQSFGDAFGNAQSIAWTSQFLYAFGLLGTSYFYMAEDTKPNFTDEEWVWSYSAFFEGERIGFKLTAQVDRSAGEAEWAFYISGTIKNQSLSEYKYMEGIVGMDSKSGNWRVFDFLNEETAGPVLSYEWKRNIYDDLKATFYFHDNNSFNSMEFDEEGTNNMFTLYGFDENIEVYWNKKENHGYWWHKVEDQKLCWTSDGSDIACSEIKL